MNVIKFKDGKTDRLVLKFTDNEIENPDNNCEHRFILVCSRGDFSTVYESDSTLVITKSLGEEILLKGGIDDCIIEFIQTDSLLRHKLL